MDPYAPINGISLERYADLAADVSEISDPAQQAETVGRKGVSPVDWEAAKGGWTARMQDMSLMGQVASRFMQLYQAALARKSPAPPVEQEAARLRAGGAPRPVASLGGGAGSAGPVPAAASTGHAVSGAMLGAGPPPGYGAAPQPGYPQPGYPQPGYPQQPGYNHQAAAFGNEVGNAFNAFGNALGSFVSGAVAPFATGTAVLVQWSDGRRYPATVTMFANGQVQVHFPDGRQVWVPQAVVTARNPGF